MKKQLAKGARITIFILIIGLMIAGTIYDETISKLLYNAENPFGIFFAAYGATPAYLLPIWTGVLMVVHSNPVKPETAGVQKVFGGIFAIGGTIGISAFASKNAPGLPFLLSLLIAILISLISSLFILYMVKDISYRNIMKLCIVMMIIMIAGTLLVQVIKTPWARPRMRLIASEVGIAAGVKFQPWYQIGNSLKDAMILAGTKADDFKSFPSGHTASAACSLALYYIASVSPRFEKKKGFIFFCCMIWVVLTAVSRIIMGAHFLTDVTMGFTVQFLVFLFAGKIMRFARQN